MSTRPFLLAYAVDLAKSAAPLTRFSHLVHAFAPLDPAGTPSAPSDATAFCRRVKAAGALPLLAVGGAESGPAFAKTEPDRLAEQLVALVRTHGYEGLDLDWEFPDQPGSPEKLVALTLALRQRLPKLLLTAAVPGSDWYGKHYEATKLLPLLSWINVMAYDFSGPWSPTAGHNAPLSFSKSALSYWTEQRGWPKEKLVLGLAAYGRGFKATRFGEKPSGKATYEELAYRNLRRLERAGWKRQRDEIEHVPYLTSPDGRELFSFDDPLSITEKVRLARAQGLRGCFFWELSQDDGTLSAVAQKAWH